MNRKKNPRHTKNQAETLRRKMMSAFTNFRSCQLIEHIQRFGVKPCGVALRLVVTKSKPRRLRLERTDITFKMHAYTCAFFNHKSVEFRRLKRRSYHVLDKTLVPRQDCEILPKLISSSLLEDSCCPETTSCTNT